MPADSDAAISSQTVGWTIPKNYSEVEITYNELKLGVFSKLSDFTILDIVQRYWHYVVGGFFILTLLLVIIIYIHNLNKELKISHQKLHQLATHDCLTGLPNRQLFEEIALKYLSMAQRSGDKVFILFLDLDHFKSINDTYGHDAGDFVLIKIASRIKQLLRPNDIISRIGGDEFLMILWGVDSVENVQEIIKRIQNIVSLPILYQKENKLQVGCSIGVSSYPDDGEDLKELIKKADLALYKGKEDGRGKVVLFQPKPSTNNETL
jgi:diguanylate cyclase (GGDEF)-like protein